MSGIQRWKEFEDWVEFYMPGEFVRVGEGTYEKVMNFGGPGAAVEYHFYARVSKGSEKIISGVNVEEERFNPVNKVIDVKDTPPECAWVYLGYVKMGRNYRRVTIEAPDGLKGLTLLCILEVQRHLETGEIERRISRTELSPEPGSGVPLGGVGAGKIELCRDGLFRNITINGNIDTPIHRSEGSFFAVHAEIKGRASGRIITSESLHNLMPMYHLKYDGIYPQVMLKSEDDGFPLRVEVRACGTILPHNIEDSSLPLALFRVRLQTVAEEPVKAAIAFSMENFLGCGGAICSFEERNTFDEGYYELWEERAGNNERPWKEKKFSGLIFEGGDKKESRSQGQYLLATNRTVSSFLSNWHFEEQENVWLKFADTGILPGSKGGPSHGERTAGAIAVTVDVHPDKPEDVCFVFAWYVPCFRQIEGQDYGHYYNNRFSSAEKIGIYGLENFDRLERESLQVPELLLKSSLPSWLTKSLCNDAYVFSTGTWLTRDGRFSVNESPTHMFGCMGTLDQKLYANHYYTLFYPELDRTELLAFARSQGKDGGIQHDLGYGHLEQKGKPSRWPDLSSALTLLSLKHYHMTGDKEYIDEVYPYLVRALLEYQSGLDNDGDGIANINGTGNTFDAEKFEGTCSYIASLWLAALKALEELARCRGDVKTQEICRATFTKARSSAIKELWNGRYFVNYYDTTTKQSCPNSHFSQLAGEFFGRLCSLGPLYGDHYVRQGVLSTLHLNYPPSLKFPTNEATPDGKMPYRKMWGWLPHARVLLGALPMYFGFQEEGFDSLIRMERVITDVNNDNRWDQRLFYEPDTGREHWGRFYMTAPATWYVYQAMLGYTWNKPEGILGIMPNLPQKLLPFEGPMFLPGFWAWIRVNREMSRIEIEFLKKFDKGLMVRELRLWSKLGKPAVVVDDIPVSAKYLLTDSMGMEERYSCKIDINQADRLVIFRE
ncbi:MAG: GH116 family glycosyl-hydrolase [Candidatus Omnitrophica bacterium]|nr:GH116 family glycosyl-hydrolase [Candidatus Omnitrophota bacterium]